MKNRRDACTCTGWEAISGPPFGRGASTGWRGASGENTLSRKLADGHFTAKLERMRNSFRLGTGGTLRASCGGRHRPCCYWNLKRGSSRRRGAGTRPDCEGRGRRRTGRVQRDQRRRARGRIQQEPRGRAGHAARVEAHLATATASGTAWVVMPARPCWAPRPPRARLGRGWPHPCGCVPHARPAQTTSSAPSLALPPPPYCVLHSICGRGREGGREGGM